MSGSCGEKEYPQKHTVRRPRMSKKNVQKKERTLPTVERTIMNKRATVIFWCDGTKTVVKRRKGEKQNRELAVLYAIAEKALGSKKARTEFIENVTDGKYENECEGCSHALGEAIPCDSDIDEIFGDILAGIIGENIRETNRFLFGGRAV